MSLQYTCKAILIIVKNKTDFWRFDWSTYQVKRKYWN